MSGEEERGGRGGGRDWRRVGWGSAEMSLCRTSRDKTRDRHTVYAYRSICRSLVKIVISTTCIQSTSIPKEIPRINRQALDGKGLQTFILFSVH